MKRILSLVIFVLGMYGMLAGASFAHAALTLTAGDNATTTPSVATSITGFQIIGPAASTTPVKLRATSGTLSLTAVTGVTMSGNNSSTVNLSGTVEKLNQALATLKYTRGSTGTDTLEISLVEPTEVFFADNGHLYKFVSGSYTWTQARDAASSTVAYDSNGYLATITSVEENNFVYNRISGNGWLGTTDTDTEKTWKWMTGPEAGLAYFQENPGGGGSAISGRYHGWASGEPNDYGDGEDCGYMYASQNGEWNDFPCSTGQGYVVEFGADGDLPVVVAQNVSIVTANVPAVTTLSPANGSTTVALTANLVMGFSKTVTGDTGAIVIRKSSDDSVVESITASSSQVTGGGSSSITINPSVTFEEGTTYYVTVAGSAFKDVSSNYFSGMSASSSWVFTTADVTAPVLSTVAASSSASTTASASWTTNEAASTKVVYGFTTSYGSTTVEANTSTRVTSHTVNLSNLVPCTIYNYAVVSRDATGNSATSTNATFTTTGCQYSSTPTTATSTVITSSTGGSTQVVEGGKTFTVTAPANVTATSSSLVIQVKAVPSDDVFTSIGKPTQAPNSVGVTVFDVTAIINGSTILDSFDAEVEIDYEYDDSEISSLDESSLWLYHYTNGAWVALNDCALDTNANTISCTTPSFSIFGIFGSPASANSSGSRSTTSSVPARVKSLIEAGEITEAENLKKQWPWLFVGQVNMTAAATTAMAVTTTSVRDLKLGMTGEDVRQLQKLLNARGFTLASSGAGSPGNETTLFGARTKAALSAYQKANGVVPAIGYFGPLTRASMKSLNYTGIWW